MSQLVKEVVKKEFNLNFFGQIVKVEKAWGSDSYELRVVINDMIKKNEIKHEYYEPEEYDLDYILRNIKKLYDTYKMAIEAKNDKLIEGVKEEILKQIALLISKIY